MSRNTSLFGLANLRGMDERWDVSPNLASNIENMVWTDQDSWRTAEGYRRITPTYNNGEADVNYWDSDYTILSIFWFCQHGNALQYIVYEDQGGFLKYFNGSDAPSYPDENIIDLEGNYISGRSCKNREISHTSYAMFGSNLYILNGTDLPICFDGRKASPCGYSQKPGQPTIDLARKLETREKVRGVPFGIGYPNSRNQYKYVVTFVNERGQESPMSQPSEKLNYDVKDEGGFAYDTIPNAASYVPGETRLDAGTYKQQPIVNIPIGPIGTVARRIYRTQNMVSFIEEGSDAAGSGSTLNYTEQFRETQYGTEFFFLDEIQDNICTIYVDTQSDLDLGSLNNKDDFGVFPSNASLLAVYKNTMFVADKNTSILRYSRALNPEVFPKLNFFNLADNQTSLITGLYAMRDALVVFKSRATYLVTGDPVNGFFAQTLSTDLGCVSPNTIKDVPGVGLMFLAHDGVYMLGSGTVDNGNPIGFVKLSTPIRNTFRRFNMTHALNFRAAIHHKDREYWLAVCLDDSEYPNHILKYSYEIGAWSLYTDVDCAGITESQDHRGYIFMAGRKDTSGYKGILVYGGSNEKAGYGSYESLYETANIALAGTYEHFSPRSVHPRLIGYGHTMNIDVIINRSPALISETGSETQKRLLEDATFPVYGTATFDNSEIYQEHRPVVIRIDINTQHEGPVNEMKIRFKNSSEFEIIGFEMEANVGSKRNIKILSSKMGGGFGL